MKERLAIVCSGGGMRCAYSAGGLCALAKEHRISEPDIVVAGSGSAGGALYYVVKQYGTIERVWTRMLSTSDFISLRRPNKIIERYVNAR